MLKLKTVPCCLDNVASKRKNVQCTRKAIFQNKYNNHKQDSVFILSCELR